MKLNKSILIAAALSTSAVFAQHPSSQSHEGKVNAILPLETYNNTSNDFYSIGKDGFIIKWNNRDNYGDHYQISDLQINLITNNPVTGDIAVYETDGISTHKISLIDCKTYNKKFTKRFQDPVASLNFSEKGNYILAGTTTVNGTYILNGRTGDVVSTISGISGIITMAQTSTSEKTAVLYSQNGQLYYYDMSKRSIKKKISTVGMLEQTVIFGGSRFFAGVKNNAIYIIDATSGKTLTTYSASSPFIFASKNSEEEKAGLYFTSTSGRNFALKLVDASILEGLVNGSTTAQPQTLKTFSGLTGRDYFTCAAKNMDTIMLGTAYGNIYTLSDLPESEHYSLEPKTENIYEKIYDIDCDGDTFYILTRNSILQTSYETRSIKTVAPNSDAKNIIKFNDSAILWSKNTKKPVSQVKLSTSSEEPKVLFTPTSELKNLKVFGNKLVYIQGSTTVGIYDFAAGKTSTIYTGTSIQDAVLVDDNTLYVAKTKTGTNDSALISVNIQTKETVRMNVAGAVAFSLSYDYDSERPMVYGIMIKTEKDKLRTEVFSYEKRTSQYSVLFYMNDEDNSAFTSLNNKYIYTNIGKSKVRGCNTDSRRTTVYDRSASVPKQARATNRILAVLNSNGSISWYDQNKQKPVSDWYLTVNGEWFEF